MENSVTNRQGVVQITLLAVSEQLMYDNNRAGLLVVNNCVKCFSLSGIWFGKAHNLYLQRSMGAWHRTVWAAIFEVCFLFAIFQDPYLITFTLLSFNVCICSWWPFHRFRQYVSRRWWVNIGGEVNHILLECMAVLSNCVVFLCRKVLLPKSLLYIICIFVFGWRIVHRVGDSAHSRVRRR